MLDLPLAAVDSSLRRLRRHDSELIGDMTLVTPHFATRKATRAHCTPPSSRRYEAMLLSGEPARTLFTDGSMAQLGSIATTNIVI